MITVVVCFFALRFAIAKATEHCSSFAKASVDDTEHYSSFAEANVDGTVSFLQADMALDTGDVSLLQGRLVFEEAPFEEENVLLLQSSLAVEMPSVRPMPPILFVKTHKTAGSSLANIIRRLGDRRNLTFVFPTQVLLPPPQTSKSDIWCDHATYTLQFSTAIHAHLKPRPLVITVLREPTDQIISRKNHGPRLIKEMSWDDYIKCLATDNRMLGGQDSCLQYINEQAYDLGWYDPNVAWSLSEWLASLCTDLDSVILTEFFDEGLVVLNQKLQVDLSELAYVRMKSNQIKIFPTEEQYEKLSAVNSVDRALYVFFNQSFWQEWFAGDVPRLGAETLKLKRTNEELEEACARSDVVACPWRVTMDNKEYMSYLEEKQGMHVDAEEQKLAKENLSIFR